MTAYGVNSERLALMGLNGVHQDRTLGLNPAGVGSWSQRCDLLIVHNPMGLSTWGRTLNPINPTPFRVGLGGVRGSEQGREDPQRATGHPGTAVATVTPMDLSVDPERAELVVLRRPQDLLWHVAIVLEHHGTEQGAEKALRDWRERLGIVGPEWVRRDVAAGQLGVGVKMIDKLRRQGRLRGRRVARTNRAYVHRDDVNAILRERGATP